MNGKRRPFTDLIIYFIFNKSHPYLKTELLIYIQNARGFPGGAVVESLPANAGDTGSSPGLGRSHMPQTSWAREPQLLSLRVWSLCPATGGAAIVKRPAHRDEERSLHRDEEWPPLAVTRESPRTNRRPNTAKKKKLKK